MAIAIKAMPVVSGQAEGEALVGSEPLSFWGGYDQRTGEIIDRRHSLSGERAAGRVLILPQSRGSSTTTAVLLEALRTGNAPAALITTGKDAFFALAGIVAEEMYGEGIPVLAVGENDFRKFQTGQTIKINADGKITVDE